jgi:hypothetical protein
VNVRAAPAFVAPPGYDAGMDFFDTLIASRLPVPVWSLAVLWLLMHVATVLLCRLANRQLQRQAFIVVETGAPASTSRWCLVRQLALGVYCFGLSQWMGGRFAAFIAGGFFIMTAFAFAASLRTVLVLRRREVQGGLDGRLAMSTALAFHESATELGARTLACAAILLLAPHMALVGATVFMGIGAIRAAVKADELAYHDGLASVKASETSVS